MEPEDTQLEYSGEFQTTVNVYIQYTKDIDHETGLDYWYLIAYTDDCMEDGFDYEPYEERLRNGEDFEDICEEIIAELSRG